jgi:hypothetical protein
MVYFSYHARHLLFVVSSSWRLLDADEVVFSRVANFVHLAVLGYGFAIKGALSKLI